MKTRLLDIHIAGNFGELAILKKVAKFKICHILFWRNLTICVCTGICDVPTFKTPQIVLGTDSPNLMLAKVSRYTVRIEWSTYVDHITYIHKHNTTRNITIEHNIRTQHILSSNMRTYICTYVHNHRVVKFAYFFNFLIVNVDNDCRGKHIIAFSVYVVS